MPKHQLVSLVRVKRRHPGSFVRRLSHAVVASVIAGTLGGCSATRIPPAPRVALAPFGVSCAVSAHRGLHRLPRDADAAAEHMPPLENSVEAIRGAVVAGIPLIEIDVRSTRDGTLFLYHDRRLTPNRVDAPQHLLGRTADSISAAELSLLRRSGRPDRGLALFRDAIAAVRGSSSYLQLDLKGESLELVDAVIRELEAADVADRAVLQLRRLHVLRYVRSQHPSLLVLARSENVREAFAHLALEPSILQVDEFWLNDRIRDEAALRGIPLLMKALGPARDHPGHWRHLIAIGARAIITDHPLEVLDHIRRDPLCTPLARSS